HNRRVIRILSNPIGFPAIHLLMATRPSSRDEFEVALVCALPLEYNAISLLFDEFWDEDGDRYGRAIGDLNTYTTRRFGNFDVVLVLLPNTGNVSAASATASLRSSYPGLRLVILTGICGGVPFSGTGDEILLGDVIISRTVIQYDYGRRYPDDFKARDTTEDILGRPNKDIRGLVTFLETELARERLEKRATVFLKQIQDLPPKGNRRRADIYKYPGTRSDRLFEANYLHKHYLSPQCVCAKCHECEDAVCEESRDSACDVVGCDDQHIIKRKRLEAQGFCEESQTPSIFIGRFGSSNCLRVLMGHEKPVTSVAFSHDSALIASGSIDKTIRLWSTSTGDCIRDFKAKGEFTMALAFSPDSALVASCSVRGIIQLWRTTTGDDHGVPSVAYSHDSAPIVLADSDTRLWDVDTANHLRIGTANSLRSAAFSHDANLIAVSIYYETPQIWHTVTGKCVHELQGPNNKHTAVAFSHDSKLIASTSSVDTGNCVQRLKGHGNDILSVAFSHDSKLIASASEDKTTRLWRVDTNGFQQEDPAVIISESTLFVFSNDSTLVASVSGKIISLWCPHTGRCTQELKGHSEEVVSIAFSHDTALIASFSRDGSARLWCTDTGDCMLKLSRLNRSRKGSFASVAFSHNSAVIAAGPLNNGSIQLWSVVDGKFLFEIPGEDPFVFSHDSSLIASLYLETGNVGLWCTTTGDLVQELQSNYPADAIQSIVFSCDSALLAAIAGEELKLWSVASGECIQTLRDPNSTGMLESVTISHDSALVAALTGHGLGHIAVWRIDTGDLVQCVDLDCGLHWYSWNLSFAKDKLGILTSIGVVAIDGTEGSIEWIPRPPHLVGLGINHDRGWIMWNNHDILRLPAEFHDSGYAISGSTVAIKTASGRVIFIRLSADELSNLYGEDDELSDLYGGMMAV
ncbi:hypothetical protein N5P37_001211, partial [Trichoderma harzianum]